jgi:hypothetical protein
VCWVVNVLAIPIQGFCLDNYFEGLDKLGIGIRLTLALAWKQKHDFMFLNVNIFYYVNVTNKWNHALSNLSMLKYNPLQQNDFISFWFVLCQIMRYLEIETRICKILVQSKPKFINGIFFLISDNFEVEGIQYTTLHSTSVLLQLFLWDSLMIIKPPYLGALQK